ncbi:sensor histidine kinase [Sphingobium yanoikuyae]|uniref:sensor histidine kinase n=1 Tax=Sphingobium yanoikuyae TaxID=13690 RepID=UPI00241E53F9|nr:HAMP domain-containing sensor histidine kinase [Sphingobium yanoikuyae]
MPAPKVIAKQPAVQSRPTDEKQLLTAGISHELRTPLTILKGRLHGIEDGVIDPDSEETARLLRQIDHVLEIVNDLDMLAQADLGRLAIARRAIDLGDVTRKVVSDLRPLFARHDIAIIENIEPVEMLGDPVRLTQVVTNLITNAAKHSQVGGRILVDVVKAEGDARLTVRDEGPGIEQGDEERIFKPFWRSASTIKRAGCPGTGLGLALTARLVDAHEGTIAAQNRRDRSGACFEMVLPLPAPDESESIF